MAMIQLPPTTVINIDQSTFEVSKMSAEVQQMVQYYDDWRQKEVQATSDLLLARAGLRDLQASLLEAIQKEQATVKPADPVAQEPQGTPAPAKKTRKKTA